MEDVNIRSRLSHQPVRVVCIEGVTDRQHVEIVSNLEHSDLMLVAQSGAFQGCSERAVEPCDSRKIMDAGYAEFSQPFQVAPHISQRIDSIYTNDDRRTLDLG